jgi:hypothetical protein
MSFFVLSSARRGLLSSGIALLVLMVARPATAQPNRRIESPQYFALELKFGPYAPKIDDEFSGAVQPFEDMFGSGTGLLSRVEFDVQLLRLFGSLGVGLSAGYYNVTGQPCSEPADPTDSSATANCETKVEGDETTLTLVPLAALAVYRFDLLADRLSIPLVPYVKFGLNYTLWWMRRGDGSVSTNADGQKGRGGNLGWQLNAGLALRLDPLDPGAAQTLDSDFGVNHTYLFAELLHVEMSGELQLGDTTVLGGLVIEF